MTAALPPTTSVTTARSTVNSISFVAVAAPTASVTLYSLSPMLMLYRLVAMRFSDQTPEAFGLGDWVAFRACRVARLAVGDVDVHHQKAGGGQVRHGHQAEDGFFVERHGKRRIVLRAAADRGSQAEEGRGIGRGERR